MKGMRTASGRCDGSLVLEAGRPALPRNSRRRASVWPSCAIEVIGVRLDFHLSNAPWASLARGTLMLRCPRAFGKSSLTPISRSCRCRPVSVDRSIAVSRAVWCCFRGGFREFRG